MSVNIDVIWSGALLFLKANSVSLVLVLMGVFVLFDSYKRFMANKDLYSVLKGLGYLFSYAMLGFLALKGFDLMINSSETKIGNRAAFVQNPGTHLSFFRISEDVTQVFAISTGIVVMLAIFVKMIMGYMGKESPTDMIHRLKLEVAHLELANSGLDVEPPVKKTGVIASKLGRKPAKDRPDTGQNPVITGPGRASSKEVTYSATGPVRASSRGDDFIDNADLIMGKSSRNGSSAKGRSTAPANRS